MKPVSSCLVVIPRSAIARLSAAAASSCAHSAASAKPSWGYPNPDYPIEIARSMGGGRAKPAQLG